MSTHSAGIESLEPRAVWNYFAGIAAVPRPSKREEKVRAHVRQFAEKHGFSVKEEPIGNLIIQVPATQGRENAPITVLQGHLDMVCEQNRGTNHDFDRDGINMVMDTDKASGRRIVRAEGTTLGADNGMGVALAFAAATSPGVVHGPLELLLTIDEEAGMSGAKAITPASFKGRRMINLDSEEDDSIYMGCAGGCDTNLTWRFDVSPVEAGAEACRVVVEGLRGGHSGGDIHEGRGNAIKLLTRVLRRPHLNAIRLGEISGGSKRNAIPREAHAVVAGPSGTIAALEKAAAAVRSDAAAESYEDGVKIRVEKTGVKEAGGVASAEATAKFLDGMATLPDGVLGMHPKVPQLVETSNNVSTAESKLVSGKIEIVVGTLSRSSSESRIEAVKDQIVAVGRLAGAAVEHANEYPGWEPNVDSPLLAACRKVYEKLFDESPKVAAIHAGLECGIIGRRVGNMDMVSFGPTVKGAHSPDEHIFVDSVEKVWKYLGAVLAELAGK